MSTHSKKKLTDLTSMSGLAKRMAYELKSNIDIIEMSKNCYDLIESRKNKGKSIKTIYYVPDVEVSEIETKDVVSEIEAETHNIQHDSGEDVLRDSGNEQLLASIKKKTKKANKSDNPKD